MNWIESVDRQSARALRRAQVCSPKREPATARDSAWRNAGELWRAGECAVKIKRHVMWGRRANATRRRYP